MKRGDFLILPVVICLAVTGCGAAGAGTDDLVPGPWRPADDAVILAVRNQNGIALDSRLATQFQHLLDRARTASPGTLASIHARPEFVLNEMLVKATGSVATAFERGAVRTGTIALDVLLASHQLASVRPVYRARTTPTAQPTLYVLSFRAPIQVPRLVTAVEELSISDISGVYPNEILGDGDNIFAQHTAGGWVIAFVHGEGDCPAGCTMRTSTRVLVGEDDTVRILPEDRP